MIEALRSGEIDKDGFTIVILRGRSCGRDEHNGRRLTFSVDASDAYRIIHGLYRDFDSRQDWGPRTVGEVTANPTHVLGNAANHVLGQLLPTFFESPRWPSLQALD
jgi:hypothetical protein